MVPVVWVASITAPASTDIIASRAALSLCRPVVTPLATTALTLTVTLSAVSTSCTDRMPLVLRLLSVSVTPSAALSPTSASAVITGASLAPAMLTVSVVVLVALPLSTRV